MKRCLYPVLVSLMAVLLFSCGESEEDKAANELIREASELLKLAERERGRKVTEAEYLERRALDSLNEAVTLYPASPRVSRLLQEKTRVGSYTFNELKEKVTAQEEARAGSRTGEGEDPIGDVLKLAGDLAGRPGPPYFQAGVLARIAGAYWRRGETALADEFFARALSAAESVEAPYYKILALSQLAGQYALAGREEEAGGLLAEAREEAGLIEYPFFRSGAAAVIASRCLEMGRDEEAREITETIEEPYYRAWILIRFADRKIEAGNADGALADLAGAREASGRIEDPDFRVEIITDCAGRLARLGDPAVPALLAEAYDLAAGLDAAAPRAGALARLASCSAKSGRPGEAAGILEQALAAAGTIEDNLFKDLVLLEIAESLIGMGDFDRVLETSEMIEVPRFKGLALAALAQHCLDTGDEATALVFAGQAREASRVVENPHFQADILIRVAGCIFPRPPVPPLAEAETAAPAEEDSLPAPAD